MARISATAQARVGAPAESVYAILANYTEHHPRILPPNFSDYNVDAGGVGAGTLLRFRVKLGGATRTVHGEVSEPRPGRELTETYDDGTVTTFTIEPDGGATLVRIDTAYEAHGPRTLIERVFAPSMLRRLYSDELARLDRYARSQAVFA